MYKYITIAFALITLLSCYETSSSSDENTKIYEPIFLGLDPEMTPEEFRNQLKLEDSLGNISKYRFQILIDKKIYKFRIEQNYREETISLILDVPAYSFNMEELNFKMEELNMFIKLFNSKYISISNEFVEETGSYQSRGLSSGGLDYFYKSKIYQDSNKVIIITSDLLDNRPKAQDIDVGIKFKGNYSDEERLKRKKRWKEMERQVELNRLSLRIQYVHKKTYDKWVKLFKENNESLNHNLNIEKAEKVKELEDAKNNVDKL